MKKISLIGSTGSVGKMVLDVVRNNPDLSVVALTAHTNADLLQRQIAEFSPKIACLTGKDYFSCGTSGTKTYAGADSIIRAVCDEADVVFVAVTGFAGLEVTLRAIELKKDVALANKEALVCGGNLVTSAAAAAGVEIIPVDSEISAVWQALDFKKQGYKKIILTASGGPFREASIDELKSVTPEQALNHPTWKMGKKITVDCATMLNKGFEVIEAHHMFGAPLDSIEVVVHPQSIIHSMVEFCDGSVLAEMSYPDMRQPIQAALTYPQKRPLPPLASMDFASVGRLEFYSPDREKFPCLAIAEQSIRTGGTNPCAMNAASEVAVNEFLNGNILFTDIARVIEKIVEKDFGAEVTLPALIDADARSRAEAKKIINNFKR